jgi:hypothetical protein
MGRNMGARSVNINELKKKTQFSMSIYNGYGDQEAKNKSKKILKR